MADSQSSGGGGAETIQTLLKTLGIQENQWNDFYSVLQRSEVQKHFQNGPGGAMTVYSKITSLQPATAGR